MNTTKPDLFDPDTFNKTFRKLDVNRPPRLPDHEGDTMVLRNKQRDGTTRMTFSKKKMS